MHATPSEMLEPVVLGTANRKKAIELADLAAPWGLPVRSLADYPAALAVDESGATFEENARLKATRQAAHLGRWVLADDSGLGVDALGGAPGVISARYAGPGASDEANRRKLLAELAKVEPARRTAHFACHLALADPQGALRATAVGRCQGRIRNEESGSGGFGYDPLFEIVEYHRTFGELSMAVKSVLSHRARAVWAIGPQIRAIIAAGEFRARG